MANASLDELWSSFLDSWPLARLKAMTLDEYHDDKAEDSFAYWVEFKSAKLGGIAGGSAFKLGIYRMKNTEKQKGKNLRSDGTWAWLDKYGETASEAFAEVKKRLLTVAKAAARGDLDAVEAADFSPLFKWKVAFLYQNRQAPVLFPVFSKEMLLPAFHILHPGTSLKQQSQAEMYREILANRGPKADLFRLAVEVEQTYDDAQPPDIVTDANTRRYWKISPGANAVAWEDWKGKGVAAIGWPDLRDLTGLTKKQFNRRALDCQQQLEGYNLVGMGQVWTFRNLKPGDVLLANKGKNALVGVGTVQEGYRYAPGTGKMKSVNHPHQVKVLWKDLGIKQVGDHANWLRTLVELDEAEAMGLLGDTEPPPSPPPPPPEGGNRCAPQNLILYGPPGTGKTYGTVSRALGLIDGEASVKGKTFAELLPRFQVLQAEGHLEFVTFHQSYGYEDFVEGIRPVLDDASGQLRYELHHGVFKRLALRAAAAGLSQDPPSPAIAAPMEGPAAQGVQAALNGPDHAQRFAFPASVPQFVLIIDEINRGNISKILGELITLLEPDKRLTAPAELVLRLSNSPKDRFAVPPNLHVIGTMNTADRSIALMDVALRRRFTFEELMPDAKALEGMLTARGTPAPFQKLVMEIFDTLNNRIRFLYDRDHQLGHAFFRDAVDPEGLRAAFTQKVIPMLQEYFYGAWDRIALVLGCPFDDKAKAAHSGWQTGGQAAGYSHPMVKASVFGEASVLGFDHDDFEDRVDARINPAFLAPEASTESLLRFFLGVLGPADHAQRLATLQAALKASAGGPA